MSKTRSIGTGLTVAGALFMAAGSARADVVSRIAVMTGSQETPANASAALGAARFVIDTDTNTVKFRIVSFDLGTAETAAHVHQAAPGVAGPVLFPLPAGSPKVGSFVYAEAQEAALLNGGMYVNVHTTGFPGGEIRGQIVTHVALLDGVQETPSTGVPALGVGLFNIDTTAGTLAFNIFYNGLSGPETASHIHGTSNYGTAAAVVFPLPAGTPKTGAWAYPSGMQQAILDGLTYVNVHTAAFPGGEIRGQIVSAVSVGDGQQEVPANASPSTEFSMVALDRVGAALGIDLRRGPTGTAETASHIHGYAPAGVNAPVVFPLAVGTRKLGVWNFGAANLTNVVDELTYANIHTTALPGGEVRGQLRFACALRIVSNPTSVTVNNGSVASLSVGATGTGTVTYQWRKGGVDLVNGGAISGATTPNLTINPVASGNAGSYDCVVTNACGSTPSTPATLTVLCYPNCDSSTQPPVLNVNDFGCFLTKYAAGDSYANCDGSTQPPVLNVGDFGCFLNRYAAGCP